MSGCELARRQACGTRRCRARRHHPATTPMCSRLPNPSTSTSSIRHRRDSNGNHFRHNIRYRHSRHSRNSNRRSTTIRSRIRECTIRRWRRWCRYRRPRQPPSLDHHLPFLLLLLRRPQPRNLHHHHHRPPCRRGAKRPTRMAGQVRPRRLYLSPG